MSSDNEFYSGSPNPPVAPKDTPTPVAPDMGSGVNTGDGAAPAIGSSQSNPPIPKGTQLNTDPNAISGTVEPHHGMLASIFQDLAGGQRTTYRQTESGPVPVKENLSGHDIARGILAAALTGLARDLGKLRQ